jgi:hypothetical protein
MQVDHVQLMDAWEDGAGRSGTERGLLLLALCAPDSELGSLARWSAGARDAALLTLHERLFGADLSCLSDCFGCRERLELQFGTHDVRAPSASGPASYELEALSYRVRFRLPDSTDLLRAEAAPSVDAGARLLFERCVVSVEHGDAAVEVGALPAAVVAAVDSRMRELDGQAEVAILVCCPVCERVESKTFDVVAHLWGELDAWARRTLREVHALASGYGWSERDILRLSLSRRLAYLELLGAAS